MKYVALLFVLANIAAAQNAPHIQLQTSATCSPVVQGSQGKVFLQSAMDEATQKKILTLLNQILKNAKDTNATNKKLDDILEYVSHLQPEINQGPCSNLQVGGKDNQQNTNCTFQDMPPQVFWSHTQDDQNHTVKLKIWVDKPFQAAMFTVTCDRPCKGVSGEIDYAGRRPNVTFGQELSWGNPNNPPVPNIVGFIVDFPAVLPPDYSVLATVRSTDGQPLKVLTVGRLTLTGAH